MSSIGGLNPSSVNIPTVPDLRKNPAAEAARDDEKPASETKVTEGVSVSISSAGFRAAKTDSNKDIDNSSQTDPVKQLLKMIRELKKQIADKQAEVAAAQSDNSMTPEARQARVANLQASIATLQASLTMVQMQLGKAMKDQPADAQMEAMSLASK
ncbi:hypothetical protein [Pseudomonas trivialis]|uniref:Chemotaxis protein n=1 Tax=Pseudomonas trivialis TaxID=200450 RepID=A0A0R2ZL03_9PSED|nr:hypothetical protein [Pseudomonas trivialis]KRP58865.1 hypothetical protein TU79_17570 [Pseudomonas trivialis]SDT17794.1 hypothetical protein SAMN04490205_5066 [Pseudomonas trivialis]